MKTFRKNIISLFEKIRRPIYYQKVLVYSFDISKYNKMFKAKIPLRISHASVSEINKLHQNPAMNLKLYCSWDFLREKIEKGTWKCIVAKFKKKVIDRHVWMILRFR